MKERVILQKGAKALCLLLWIILKKKVFLIKFETEFSDG